MRFIKSSVFILIAIATTVFVQDKTVFKTSTGKKYHLASCRMVKNVSEEITVAAGKESGLEPCKICNPQTIYNGAPPSHKAQGQNGTVQCNGYTKAGNRCKHVTTIANGYCYQHQPNSSSVEISSSLLAPNIKFDSLEVISSNPFSFRSLCLVPTKF